MNFLILGEGPTYGINGCFGAPDFTNFTKVNTKFCLSLHYNADNSCLFVNGMESLKVTVKTLIFQLNIVSEVFLMDFVKLSPKKICLNGNVYNF